MVRDLAEIIGMVSNLVLGYDVMVIWGLYGVLAVHCRILS